MNKKGVILNQISIFGNHFSLQLFYQMDYWFDIGGNSILWKFYLVSSRFNFILFL